MSRDARTANSAAGDNSPLPSWFFSLALHGLIVMLLFASIPGIRRGGASEASRELGLVVVHGDPDADGGTDREEGNAPAEADPAPAESAAPPAAQPKVEPTPPNDAPAAALPAGEGSGTPPPDGPPASDVPTSKSEVDADIKSLTDTTDRLRTETDGVTGNGVGINDALGRGKGRTKVFGLPGEGYKFVYVFDRSASMGGNGRSTLAAAKAELLKSLSSLGETHQFQIIFYNEEPSVLNIAGRSRLVFGTKQNKELARRFVGGITADGATHHEDAILMALKMRPDVIFFLTDADEPALSDAQLKRIHDIADGVTTINTIEFGSGPSIEGENFLARLAHQNAGEYAYFDITALKDGK